MCLCICIGISLVCLNRQAHPSLLVGREAPPAQPLALLLHTVLGSQACRDKSSSMGMNAPQSMSLLKCRSLGGTLSASFS